MNALEPRIILAGPEPLIESLEWQPASLPPDADTTMLLWILYEDGDADWAAGRPGGAETAGTDGGRGFAWGSSMTALTPFLSDAEISALRNNAWK